MRACLHVVELQRILGSVFEQTRKILAGSLTWCVLVALLLHSCMVIEMFYYFNNILKGMFPSQLEGRKFNPLSVASWLQD